MIESSKYNVYGNPEITHRIIRLTGEHEKELIKEELIEAHEVVDDDDWCIITVPVGSWERDLSPWPINENESKTGAEDTLRFILEEVIKTPEDGCKYYLAGYSLAGLFSLWASYQTDIFDGVAAVSPSVWYPGWMEYIDNNRCLAKNVYLSLGSKEHKTRNKMMACVLDNINHQYETLKSQSINATFEKNEGNHFRDVHIRMAKGLVWLRGVGIWE